LKTFKNYLLRNNSADKLMCRICLYYISNQDKMTTQPHWFDLTFAYKKICKKEINPNRQKVFLNALHNLNNALKTFLLIQALEEDSFEKDQMLIKIYQERKLENETIQLIEKRKEKIIQKTPKEHWSDLQLFQLDYKLFFEIKAGKVEDNQDLLTRIMYQLDSFFCTFKMLVSSAMENRKNLYNEAYQTHFFDNIQNHLSQIPIEENINAHFYHACFEAIKFRDLEHTTKLANFIKINEPLISLENQGLGYISLINCWLYLHRKNYEDAPKKMFQIYKLGLPKGFFQEQGQISPTAFVNIVSIACLEKEYQWANNFINKYENLLPTPHKMAAVNLAKGSILYSEEKYKEMLSPLNQVQYLDSTYGIRAKAMILRGFYEDKQSYELISSYCKSFSAYLKQNRQFQVDPLDAYKRLIEYVQIFIRPKRKMPQSLLIEKIKKEQDFQFKDWVLEKAMDSKNN